LPQRAAAVDLVPANRAQQRVNLLLRGHPVTAVERPCFAQHARSDVECAVGKTRECRGEVEKVGALFVDSNWGAGADVDLVHYAVSAVATELALDTPGFGGNRVPHLLRHGRWRVTRH